MRGVSEDNSYRGALGVVLIIMGMKELEVCASMARLAGNIAWKVLRAARIIEDRLNEGIAHFVYNSYLEYFSEKNDLDLSGSSTVNYEG